PDCRGSFLKGAYPWKAVSSIFDADSVRDVLKVSHPAKLTRQQLTHPSIALGEDLEHVPVGSTHDVTDLRDELSRHVFMKQVAHRVYEDLSRPFPMQRLLQFLGHETQFEAVFKRVPRDAAETLSEDLCVTEFAARADFCAAAYRVPCRVRPFNWRSVAHTAAYVFPVTGEVNIAGDSARF